MRYILPQQFFDEEELIRQKIARLTEKADDLHTKGWKLQQHLKKLEMSRKIHKPNIYEYEDSDNYSPVVACRARCECGWDSHLGKGYGYSSGMKRWKEHEKEMLELQQLAEEVL